MGQSKSTSKNQGKWEYQQISQTFPSNTSEWIPFNALDNFLLEKAYFRKQKVVDLDDSTIHFKNMIQILKPNDKTDKPRLVRRIKEESKSAEGIKENQFKQRRQRFIGFENPKALNSMPTSLPNLLLFFENRGPEIKKFANLFRECEVLPTLEKFNKEILPLLIEAIQKEAQRFPDKSNVQSIVKLFEEKFLSFKQFYSKVLMAYSLNESLFKNLNYYLRNENWIQLDDLLPFAFCLCKAFLYAEFLSNNPPKSFINYNDEDDEFEEIIITLYRGTELDENLLALFNPKKCKHFSWQAFTSTTTNQEIANNFLYANPNMRKIPVKFIIEASIGPSYFDSPNFIDVSHFSAHPEENEVLIAPGSVFELKSFYRDNKGAEIRLELITSPAKLPCQGQILSETIETELKKGITSKILCLEGKELLEAVDLLRNNNLIEELEFCFCKFADEKVLNHIIQALVTIKSIQKLAFFSVFPSEKKHYSPIFKDLIQLNIQSLHISERSLDDASLSSLAKGLKTWASSLQNLSLDFEFCYFLTNKGLSNFCSYGLKYLTSLDTLSLNTGFCCQITDEGFTILGCHLRYLISLTTLNLSLPSSHLTNKGLLNLCSQGLQKLANLKALILNLKQCQLIKDEGIQILCSEGIGKLTSLISLNLSFESCKFITDNSLNILCFQGLSNLACLTSLTLNFQSCKKMSDNGLFHLFCQGIKSLSSLQSLEINLRGCLLISDKGLDIISSQDIKNLKSINLNFGSRNKISDEGFELFKAKIHSLNKNISVFLSNSVYHNENEEKIKNFTFKRILKNNFTKTTSMKNFCPNTSFLNSSFLNSSVVNNENPENTLTVYFTEQLEEELYSQDSPDSSLYYETFNFNASGNKFTDDQLTILASKGLPKLVSLSTLNLNFGSCINISSKGLSSLSQTIGQLISLSALSLNFESIPQIDDEDLNCLSFFGIQKLVFLNTLRLNFASCKRITDKGIERVCTKGIRKLNVLSALSLTFGSCEQITDVALTTLSFQAIQYLTNLTTLDLNFESCQKITDKGLVNLSSSGIKNLEHLESLSLNFRFCTQITDGGLSKLSSSGLNNLASLSTLNLDFGYCKHITDKGMSNLCSQGILQLKSLLILNLNFRSCDNVTDQGVKYLCLQTIKNLNLLTTLNLHFEFCHRISGAGFRDLKKIFKYFGYKLDRF